MPDFLSGYLTTQEVADLLGFHIKSVRHMLTQGTLEGKKVGNMWFVSKQSVDNYVKNTRDLSKTDPRRGMTA